MKLIETESNREVGWRKGRGRSGYHDDDEIQPAPGVGEVFLEAERQPLDQHLDEEDDSEDAVHVVEDVLQDRPLRQVDIFERLSSDFIGIKPPSNSSAVRLISQLIGLDPDCIRFSWVKLS